MNDDNLRLGHKALIVATNPEWVQVLNLRTIVRHEFHGHGFLTVPTLDAILDWKLRKQRKRTEKHRDGNSPELVKELTGVFWRITHRPLYKKLWVKVGSGNFPSA